MIEKYLNIIGKIKSLKDVPPLLFRLILAYGFYDPAMKKIGNIDGIASWFASMNYPLPTLNAYLAATTETLGFILLFIGFATRIISIPLMFVMLVAIFTVHFGNGFAAGDNGFEIPLYYFLMLFSLLITGPGKFSIDAVLDRIMNKT